MKNSKNVLLFFYYLFEIVAHSNLQNYEISSEQCECKYDTKM